MLGQHACTEFPVDRASAPFHPLNDYGAELLHAVGGPSLAEVAGFSLPVVPLGSYIPQVRMRRCRRQLPERLAYGIRVDQILRRRVWNAEEVREFCQIPEQSLIVLFCFAKDPVLEDLWDDLLRLSSIATGGWDLITAPSYSLWHQRPRPMHFHSIKRSFDCYQALHSLGAQVIPRVEFIDNGDLVIQAQWLQDHPEVEMVSLDWMTCRLERDWIEGARIFSELDRLTEGRLHYVVNGTTALERIACLVQVVGSRITFTDATAATPLANDNRLFHLPTDLDTQWSSRISARERVVRQAIELGNRRDGRHVNEEITLGGIDSTANAA